MFLLTQYVACVLIVIALGVVVLGICAIVCLLQITAVKVVRAVRKLANRRRSSILAAVPIRQRRAIPVISRSTAALLTIGALAAQTSLCTVSAAQNTHPYTH